MLFKWMSFMISQLTDSICRSIKEENIHWDEITKQLNEEVLISIERYNHIEKCLNDTKFFMRCIVSRKDFKQEQDDKSTQTIYDKTLIIENASELIDDVILKLEQFHFE